MANSENWVKVKAGGGPSKQTQETKEWVKVKAGGGPTSVPTSEVKPTTAESDRKMRSADDITFWQRVLNTGEGGAKRSAAQATDALRAQYEATQGGRTQRTMDELRDIEWAVANAKHAYDTAQDAGAKRGSKNELDANLRKLEAYATVLGEGAYDVVLKEAYDTAAKIPTGDVKTLYAGLAKFDPDSFNGVQQQATKATAQLAHEISDRAEKDIANA